MIYFMKQHSEPTINMGSTKEPAKALSDTAVSYLNLLLSSIDARDWDLFTEVGIKNPKAFRSIAKILATSSEFNGMTFLHAAMRHNPPVALVADICKICPDAPSRRDCLNRTPLHVAAGVGADVEVIQYLATVAPETCTTQDEDGRTPLHFLCDIDCQLFEGEETRRDPPSYEVVRALLCASIDSAAMEDADEMSPLEYAIFSHADIRVVKLLQKAAQKTMKKEDASRKEEKKSIGVCAAA